MSELKKVLFRVPAKKLIFQFLKIFKILKIFSSRYFHKFPKISFALKVVKKTIQGTPGKLLC